MAKQCDLFLIDGFSLLFRSYYGYPPNLTTPQGTPINAVYGFVTLMLNAIKQFEPTYFGICLDRKEPTYRHTMFPEYKANRSEPDEEFLVQLPEFKKVIASFDIPMIEMPGFESDDLLGTLSHQFSKLLGGVGYSCDGLLPLVFPPCDRAGFIITKCVKQQLSGILCEASLHRLLQGNSCTP